MEGYMNVFERRSNDLIKISIIERKDKGIGCLFLDFSENDKLECFYLVLQDEKFPLNLRKNIEDRIEIAPKSILYFYLFDTKEERIVEIDLDKNSNFHEKTNKNYENITSIN